MSSNKWIRLETILKMLLQQISGSLEPSAQTNIEESVKHLAALLADEGVIMLEGRLDTAKRAQWEMHVQLWMHLYAELYYLFNYGLYGATDTPNSFMPDRNYPIVVVFEAKNLFVVQILTDLIVPYVTIRGTEGVVSLPEIRGLIDIALEELCATDIDAKSKQFIYEKGTEHIRNLLLMDIKQTPSMLFNIDMMTKLGISQVIPQKQTKTDELHTVDTNGRPQEIPGLKKPRRGAREMPAVSASPTNIIPLPPLPKPPARKQGGGGDDDGGGLVGLLSKRRGS